LHTLFGVLQGGFWHPTIPCHLHPVHMYTFADTISTSVHPAVLLHPGHCSSEAQQTPERPCYPLQRPDQPSNIHSHRLPRIDPQHTSTTRSPCIHTSYNLIT
jgi:hypothetical protein